MNGWKSWHGLLAIIGIGFALYAVTKQEWVVAIAILALLFSAFAAFNSERAAYASQMTAEGALKAARADIYLNLRSEFGTEDMRHHLEYLKEKFPQDCDKGKRYEELKTKHPEGHSDNPVSHRRTVAMYFRKIEGLLSLGYIDPRLAKVLVSEPQARILFEVLEPLEKAIYPGSPIAIFKNLAEVFPSIAQAARKNKVSDLKEKGT